MVLLQNELNNTSELFLAVRGEVGGNGYSFDQGQMNESKPKLTSHFPAQK